MTDQPIRLYYHARSPYSRLGVHLIADSGIDCETIVFTGPPEGIPFSDPTENPAKLDYFRHDVGRMTARLGLPLHPPENFMTDFDPAIRAGIAAGQAGYGLAFAHALSEARWGEGKDVADPAVLEACAAAAGWTGFDPNGAESASKRGYVQQRRLIEQDKVFGVPFLVWGERKYWGHDRFDLFLEEYRATDR